MCILANRLTIADADIIAMGVTWGVSSCGGPSIPFRGGRRDATAAGRPGVPEPFQDLATHTEKFRQQGLSATEMITLVACGHTLGGVRSSDFPELVAPNPDRPGVDQFAFFDTTGAPDTPDAFDHSV